MRALFTKMSFYWALCLCFFGFIAFACFIAYYLIADITAEHIALNSKLQLLAYQLTLLTLGSSIIFSAGLRVYFYYRNPEALSDDPPLQKPLTATEKKTINTLHTKKLSNELSKASHPLNILIVDDNDANIMVIENLLSRSDRLIFTANNGLDAIKLFEKEPIDIVFMDLEMTGMNGSQTLQHIRALEKTSPATQQQRTPVIAVSAHSRKAMQFTVLQAGFDDYVEKPVNQKSTDDTLMRWLPFTANQKENHEIGDNKKELFASNVNIVAHPFPQQLKTLNSNNKDNLQKVVNIKSSLIQSNNNCQLAKDMLQLLIAMIRKEKKELYTLYDTKDWEKLYQLNHKIYGGSSYCGVPQLQATNKKLEMLLQRQLTFHSPNQSPTSDLDAENSTTSHTDDIYLAVQEIQKAIDDIIKWDDEHDIDIIFNIT